MKYGSPIDQLVNRREPMKTKKATIRKSRSKKSTTPVVDVKVAAANDQPKTEIVLTKRAISARSEGVRLYQLAGRPDKATFIRLCGKRGPAMTWTARAEHLGVSTPEEAAEKFAAMKGK
jgi:hypothetical protein